MICFCSFSGGFKCVFREKNLLKYPHSNNMARTEMKICNNKLPWLRFGDIPV